jgi:hypothetical protein
VPFGPGVGVKNPVWPNEVLVDVSPSERLPLTLNMSGPPRCSIFALGVGIGVGLGAALAPPDPAAAWTAA